MLQRSSLERKEFKEDELKLIKKFDVKNLAVIFPENLNQLLIWTSELAQHNHAQFIEFSNKLGLMAEDNVEEREEINKKIKFYRNSAFEENQIKDFYLKKLLDQGEATVRGYIKHPIKQNTKYAVISYHGYDFVSFATPEIIEKSPLNFIDFVQIEAPKTLADIHPDEALLLSAIHDFAKPIVDKIEQIQKEPETQIFLKNIAYWISNHERTSPFMDKILSEMETNPNLSEARHTISYKQVFKLLSESEDLENTSLLDLINQSYFQEGILECFDNIEISNHLKNVKKL